jgi:hypothetical protein
MSPTGVLRCGLDTFSLLRRSCLSRFKFPEQPARWPPQSSYLAYFIAWLIFPKKVSNYYKTINILPGLTKSTLISTCSTFFFSQPSSPSPHPPSFSQACLSTVLPLGLCPWCCLGLKCILYPVRLTKCHPSIKVKLTFQFHRGSFLIAPFFELLVHNCSDSVMYYSQLFCIY